MNIAAGEVVICDEVEFNLKTSSALDSFGCSAGTVVRTSHKALAPSLKMLRQVLEAPMTRIRADRFGGVRSSRARVTSPDDCARYG